MTNLFFKDEEITKNDVYFICYMVERIARRLKQHNNYIVNKIGKDNLEKLLSLANVLHCKNPLDVEDEWIKEYDLKEGDFDITQVNSSLVSNLPRPTQVGKVYQRLIYDTLGNNESEAEAIIRVYNNPICERIDDYNCSAYYEPSYIIKEAYLNGGF